MESITRYQSKTKNLLPSNGIIRIKYHQLFRDKKRKNIERERGRI